jgi:hypothetical protein
MSRNYFRQVLRDNILAQAHVNYFRERYQTIVMMPETAIMAAAGMSQGVESLICITIVTSLSSVKVSPGRGSTIRWSVAVVSLSIAVHSQVWVKVSLGFKDIAC